VADPGLDDMVRDISISAADLAGVPIALKGNLAFGRIDFAVRPVIVNDGESTSRY
jgi:hypothetical protein